MKPNIGDKFKMEDGFYLTVISVTKCYVITEGNNRYSWKKWNRIMERISDANTKQIEL